MFEPVLCHIVCLINFDSSAPSMTSHYVQYHKLTSDNPLPTEFSVRTNRPGSVEKHDVIWLLVGVRDRGPTQYHFAYWFVVNEVSKMSNGMTRLSGERGTRFDPAWSISFKEHPWFEGFLGSTLGRGAFGFRPIPAELREMFQRKMEQGALAEEKGPAEDAAPPDSIDERQWQSILTRRGQQAFRLGLLEAYRGRCAVSESRVVPLLEAAHITSHAEGGDYRLSNGILLRADIHTLFDLHLLGIDDSLRVHLKDSVRGSEFARFHGKRIETLPASTFDQPSSAALQKRFKRFLAAQDLSR
jgi:hypothetical protein